MDVQIKEHRRHTMAIFRLLLLAEDYAEMGRFDLVERCAIAVANNW